MTTNDMEPPDGAEMLAMLDNDRTRLAIRTRRPSWYAPAYGVLVAALNLLYWVLGMSFNGLYAFGLAPTAFYGCALAALVLLTMAVAAMLAGARRATGIGIWAKTRFLPGSPGRRRQRRATAQAIASLVLVQYGSAAVDFALGYMTVSWIWPVAVAVVGAAMSAMLLRHFDRQDLRLAEQG